MYCKYSQDFHKIYSDITVQLYETEYQDTCFSSILWLEDLKYYDNPIDKYALSIDGCFGLTLDIINIACKMLKKYNNV